ncbi:MAG: DNA-directed RNA polymerase subunit B'' [Candidatus Woesearchaeota archaeon]
MKPSRLLIKKYFESNSVIESIIKSYNDFIDFGMQQVVNEIGEIEPTIIPANLEEYKIKFGKIRIGSPQIVEADGSVRDLYPFEARIRELTYAAPIYLEFIPVINQLVQKPQEVKIGMMPIMLKSKYCRLYNLKPEELIELGEDPDDFGGYFIINGSEKVIINIEDLSPNNFIVNKDPITEAYVGRVFSENGAYRIPLTLELRNDLIFSVSFTRLKKVPLVVLLKALGINNDEEIMKSISPNEEGLNLVLINLYEFAEIKDSIEAIDYIARNIGMTHPFEIRVQRMEQILDQFLLPHVGVTKDERRLKAYTLAKYANKLIKVAQGIIPEDDRDHYMNKRIKTAGDSLTDLFRYNFRILVKDIMYNFQRIVKRGKLPPLNTIVRDKLFTSRFFSAMATGNWVGERTGVCQRYMRWSYLESLSHTQRVSSLLDSNQENFDARALHPTHFGRLCAIETPEGKNVGLRKNLAIMSYISRYYDETEIYDVLEKLGLKISDPVVKEATKKMHGIVKITDLSENAKKASMDLKN